MSQIAALLIGSKGGFHGTPLTPPVSATEYKLGRERAALVQQVSAGLGTSAAACNVCTFISILYISECSSEELHHIC